MIARREPKIQLEPWQHELRDAYTQPLDLLRDLDLAAEGIALHSVPRHGFAFRVPRPFAARMRPRDPHDPLLLQVLPRAAESRTSSRFSTDPVGDLASQRSPGLLHKYRGRALLVVTGGCAINCRYCFRREFPYSQAVGTQRITAALAEIRADPSIAEIILSGGDPLTLKDEMLSRLVAELAAIPQLERLRIHTRVPVTIPSRVTPAMLEWLTGSRLQPVMVVHVNHANEIDQALGEALRRLRAAAVPVLNQTVLLKDINDDAQTLEQLSLRLFEFGVMPYYVHLLDRVQGAMHFEVSAAAARRIASRLRARLPGYLVPRFVREIPGASAKTPLL